jgi:hypothetical protein
MNERPIFVVGFQRSGTTLLQSLLGAHPRIAAPPEVHFFFRIHQLRDYWGDLAEASNAARVMHELVNAPHGLLDGCGFDEEVLTEAFLRTDRSYGALLHTLLDDFAARAGKPRWSEKTPNQRPRLIWSILPDAQVVHIVRDPREVVASAVAAWPHDQPAFVLGERLRDFTRTALADGRAAPAGSYLLIRYEDLAADANTVLHTVFEFLGEHFDARVTSDMTSRGTALPASAPAWQTEAVATVRAPRQEWEQRLSAVQRALVSAAVRSTVDTLGYPPVSPGRRVAGALLAPLRLPFLVRQRARNRAMTRARTPQERYDAVQQFVRSRQTSDG